MDPTAVQQASIAAEAINGLNLRLLATLDGAEDADLTQIKGVYEVACSLKLLAQRLTLTATELGKVVGGWHEDGHLRTAPAVDGDALVVDFGTAMTDAHMGARAMFATFEHATTSLSPMGWQEAAPAAQP